MTTEFDMEMLRMAYGQAYKFSTDPSTQNGAVIRSDERQSIVALGANHFPGGVKEAEGRWERPMK